MDRLDQVWAGIDAGKGHHHVVVIDRARNRLLSRRVANNELELLAVLEVVLARSAEVMWAIDLADGPAALIIALLLGRGQRVVYLPGIAVNRATAGYRGEGKTDLLTELTRRSFGKFARSLGLLAKFASRDQRRGRATGSVAVGGAAGWVA